MLIPIKTAAEILQKKPGTLRRYCKQGMPHQPGGKGRGKAVLVDPEQARQWIGAEPDTQHLLTLACDLPQLLAQVIFQCWQHAEGHDKRKLAGVLTAVWYASSTELLDHLREKNSEVPDIQNPLPPEIEHLRKIARNV